MTNLEFKQLRMAASIPQHEVSYRAGMDRTRFVLWERGCQRVRHEEVQALEKVLGDLISERLALMANLFAEFESRQEAAAA